MFEIPLGMLVMTYIDGDKLQRLIVNFFFFSVSSFSFIFNVISKFPFTEANFVQDSIKRFKTLRGLSPKRLYSNIDRVLTLSYPSPGLGGGDTPNAAHVVATGEVLSQFFIRDP